MVKYLASGKIIVNNKGKAVKQYEPWYSTTREFEDEDLLTNYGVTPIMHYDPLSRLIQTDFPDNTTTKVTFDVWQQKNYDQNDCDTSSAHYNTPQVLDLDVLGRAFQTIDDNGTFGLVTTHNQLDITGRILVVTDALGRTATQNKYALSEKHQIYVKNIDSGERWMLNDTVGNPCYVWDSRNHRIKTLYDTLLRPTQTLLKTANNPEITTQLIIYGTSSVLNNILQIIEIDAQDGKTSFEYDFKGNISKQTKQFAQNYQNELDWNGTVALNNEIFATQTTYDALNRPVTVTQPDNSVIAYTYDKGGLLQSVALTGSATASIQNITYNSKGQREDIYYGNNTKTKYYYHPLNFRITRILTTRNNGQDILQDLNYTYDSVGNITKIEDNAQQTFYFNNQVVAPTGTYQYDALYRLIQATGRELTALQMPIHEDFPNSLPCPNTAGNAMQNYTHNYQYDKLGNMLQMQSVGNWTRDYVYNNPMTNNYLLGHGSGTVYTYDAHGNMLTMPHLTSMVWDYLDQLQSASNGTFTSYYNYNAEGNRTRKVVVKNNIIETRYYINGYELYRKEINGVVDFERKTINISDDEKVFVRIEQKTGENPVVRYQYDNHLGSACLELDNTGQIISYEEYHPFGTTSYRSGRSQTEVSLKRYKYCGKERDEETGLYYYGMRYYAAWICRFVSVDPLQFKYPYYTPYQYAGNKPITYIDLDGGEEKEKEEVPKVTVYKNKNSIKIGKSKWIEKYKYDWVSKETEGGGLWLYKKAKKELNATPFGAALVVAFAAEEGGWGEGNYQKNKMYKGKLWSTHNMFSLLSLPRDFSRPNTPHGTIIDYKSYSDCFDAWKNLINKKYSLFTKVLNSSKTTIDDINKSLKSGPKYHVIGGYTDADKGKAIINGTLKYVMIFIINELEEDEYKTDKLIQDYQEKINELLNKKSEESQISEYQEEIKSRTEHKNKLNIEIEELKKSYSEMKKNYNW